MKTLRVVHAKDPVIYMDVTEGHFVINDFHSSHYLDLSTLKTCAIISRDVARELGLMYKSSTMINTIICLEGTEVIGAYLAEELRYHGFGVVNSGLPIRVITPITDTNRKLRFVDNLIEFVAEKNVLLLMASIVSGRIMNLALECIDYYGGSVTGIATLFWATQAPVSNDVQALFTTKDVPEFQLSKIGECPMCKEGIELDALITSDGYIKIRD
jgi:orotate phosphoribosyltransferase